VLCCVVLCCVVLCFSQGRQAQCSWQPVHPQHTDGRQPSSTWRRTGGGTWGQLCVCFRVGWG